MPCRISHPKLQPVLLPRTIGSSPTPAQASPQLSAETPRRGHRRTRHSLCAAGALHAPSADGSTFFSGTTSSVVITALSSLTSSARQAGNTVPGTVPPPPSFAQERRASGERWSCISAFWPVWVWIGCSCGGGGGGSGWGGDSGVRLSPAWLLVRWSRSRVRSRDRRGARGARRSDPAPEGCERADATPTRGAGRACRPRVGGGHRHRRRRGGGTPAPGPGDLSPSIS